MNMKRSSCASGSGYVPSCSMGFCVAKTKNPIEQEGTYPLPEAQLDRFLFMIHVDYPSEAEERQIMKMATGVSGGKPGAVLSGDEIINLQQVVRRMPVAEHVYA